MSEKQSEVGLTLFRAAGLIDPMVETIINQVYTAKMLKNKAGDVVGYSVKSTKPDQVRKELGLPATKDGREQLAIEIRKRQDAQWAETKAWLINNMDLTLVGFQQRTNAKGQNGTTIKLVEAEKPNDVQAMARKLEKLTGRKVVFGDEIKPPVDVQEVKPQAALPEPKPEVTPDEQDTANDEERLMRELEAEERAVKETVEA